MALSNIIYIITKVIHHYREEAGRLMPGIKLSIVTLYWKIEVNRITVLGFRADASAVEPDSFFHCSKSLLSWSSATLSLQIGIAFKF